MASQSGRKGSSWKGSGRIDRLKASRIEIQIQILPLAGCNISASLPQQKAPAQ